MLIAISGAQGSGKTTVLNNLQSLGFNVVERKTARSILTEWNTTLDAVYRDPVMAQKFQEEALVRKANDEHDAIESNQLWFTERSYADVFTYTLLTVGRYNEYNDWLNDYFDRCSASQSKYLGVFYLEGRNFKMEDDGVRGINQHYVRLVDNTLQETIEKMTIIDPNTFVSHPPSFRIPTHISTVDDRTREIARQAQLSWLYTRLPATAYNTARPFKMAEEHI